MPADSGADLSRVQVDASRKASSPSSGFDPNVPFVPGDTLGRYVTTGRLSEGGMGVVYRAFDPILERRVAIKFVSLNLRNRELVHSVGARRRLRAEARALASLSHPNIVPIFDVGTVPDGRAYVAMELIEGGTLRDVMPFCGEDHGDEA